MVMGQVGQMMLQLVDAAMIGRVSVDALAAASFGSNIMHVPILFGFGLCMPAHILAAETFARGDRVETARWALSGLWITAIYGLVCAFVVHGSREALAYFGQPEQVVTLAHDYVGYLAWSLIPMLAYQCLKNVSEARRKPWLPFFVMAVGFCANVVLNWLFIFGKLGLPEMGLAGAGLATLLARMLMLLILAGYVVHEERAHLSSFKALMCGLFTRERIGRWLALGVPGALQIIFEAGAFILAGIMMGWIGATTLAAHHITITHAGFIFMVPLGMSFATCIQVAAEVGRDNRAGARRIGWTNMICVVLFMAVCAVITFLCREWIPLIFVEPEKREVIALASSFLVVVALFHIFDGVQVVMLGAMRGLSELKFPALLLFVSFWPIGLPLGYLLAFERGIGGLGIWWGLLTGLGIAAVTLSLRFASLTRPDVCVEKKA